MCRFHYNTAAQDLIILGGGAAAVTALITLIRQLQKQLPDGTTSPHIITILERAHTAGNGTPYDPEQHHPILRVNNPNSGMIIDTENPLGFVHWLQKHSSRLKHEYPQLVEIITDTVSGKDIYAPRMLFGKYLQERLIELVAAAKQLGIRIEVQTGVNITDVTQDATLRWYVKTETNGDFTADNLLIAAGHLPSSKFPALHAQSGYFNTPYTDLSAIPDAPVIILGSGLSAIDAAKLLAHRQITAPIYMISPSGQLPRVKGPLNSTHYEMQFLTEANLRKKNIRLAEVMRLFTEEIKYAMNNSAWTLDAVMRKALQKNDDALRTLRREIRWVENNKMRGWQLMLARIWFAPLPLVWEYLDDRDRREFASVHFSLFLKWGAGMTLGSAKEMAALADKGQLRVMKCREEVMYREEIQQFEFVSADGKIISAATVINATGHGCDISQNPTLHMMVKSGLIRQEKVRGGIEIDSEAHVIDINGKRHDNAFAMGAITLGSDLGASSIEMAAWAAKELAPRLALRLRHCEQELLRRSSLRAQRSHPAADMAAERNRVN